jgi:hypothetical protein
MVLFVVSYKPFNVILDLTFRKWDDDSLLKENEMRIRPIIPIGRFGLKAIERNVVSSATDDHLGIPSILGVQLVTLVQVLRRFKLIICVTDENELSMLL